MSPQKLGSAITDELEDLSPMPSVVPAVLADGARRERRRRWAGAGLAAAAVVGVVAVGTTLTGIVDTSSPDAAAPTAATRPSGVPITDTNKEFTQWAAGKFSEVLPERFGEVRPTRPNSFVTAADGQQVTFNINITYVDWKSSNVKPGETDLMPHCGRIGADSCSSLPRLRAIAYHNGGDDGGYAALEMNVTARYDGADDLALNLFTPPGTGPVPLSDDEILDVATSPELDEIVDEYIAHPRWPYSGTIINLDRSETGLRSRR